MKHLRALIIEDSEDDCEILLRHLRQNNFQVEYLRVETAEAMEDALEQQEWQIILSDFSMPRFDGLGALATLQQTKLDIPFIIISGTIGEDTAVQAMLAGVDDYFIKGKLGRLGPAIERELEEAENRAERRRVEAELEENKKRLQLALFGSGMGVWEWNLETDAIFWSPECYKIYGVEASAETITDFTKLVHPEDLAKLVSAGQIAIDNHQKYSAEFRIINPHGEIQWLANNGLTEYGTNGLPVRLIGTVQDITERKKAENTLRESEENFRAITQASTQFVWWADKYGAGTELFQWFSRLSGRNITDVFGIIELIHPDDIEIAQQLRKQAFKQKSVFNMVIRVLTKNNEYCYLATRTVPVFNKDGSFRQWIGTFNDITDRMHAEEALRKNEAQLKLVSDTVPTLIMQLDARLHVLFTNKPCLQFFGLAEAEILGKHISKVFNETAYKLILPEFERVLTGEPFIVERLSFQEDGSRFLRFNYVPDFDEKGNVQGFFAFVIDLTENKRSEEKLRKSEERFRSLVNATAQIVWTADSNGILQSANTPHGAPLGGTSDNMMDEWISRLHAEDKERATEEFQISIRSKKRYKGEYRMLNNDGTYHHYISRGTPVYEEDGTVREWVGTLTDVTNRKFAEEQLRKSEEQLRQAQKLESVGRLAGGIAHDFNNMLTAINGYSELTLRRLNADDPLRHNLEEIKKAGERSASLTQQLLAFSRRQILQVEIIDINQIIVDSIVLLQRLIGEDIQIVSVLNPKTNFIKADSGQLSQMLMNLAVNSRDAMPQGGTITIETDNVFLDEEFAKQHAGSKTGNYVMLAVSDIGSGIDEETLKQIFEPFFTTKEVGKGTGLGLATIYGIITQLGGYVYVDSTVGKGTTFEIYLPSV